MNSQEAFEWLNGIAIATTKNSLSECEKDVFIGIWAEKTYQEISDNPLRSYQYVKETGAKLFQKIELILQVKVNKKSLRLVVEQFYQTSTAQATDNNLITIPRSHISELTNPFIPLNGVIDRPELFFNRTQEIQRIFELLNNRSSVAVIGERAIGKSSLLIEICRQAKMHLKLPRTAVYLNLLAVENEADFYSYLCDEIGIADLKGYQLTRALNKQNYCWRSMK